MQPTKFRTDSWASQLTPEQQMNLYRKAKQFGVWTQAVQWAATEFKLDKEPSQSSFYRWMSAMSDEERRQRLEATAIAAAEADELGKKAPRDETIIAALKARILEAALSGNTRDAAELTRIADVLHNHLMKEKALALAKRRLDLFEQVQLRTVRQLRDEKTAIQEELNRNKKVPLVMRWPEGGLPILGKHADRAETVTAEVTTEPASDPAASPRDLPAAPPPDNPN